MTETTKVGRVMAKETEKERMGKADLDDLDEREIVVDRNIQGRGPDACVVGLGGSNVMRPDRSVSGASSLKRL